MGPVRHMATIEQTVGRVPATTERGAVLMEVAGLTKRYRDLDALSDISFTVKRGATLAAAPAPRVFDLSGESVGAEPTSFAAIVGNWVVAADGDKRVLAVDGRKWKQGQASAGLADKARAIYRERYAEFLDNVQAYAYYPYAVAKGIDDFREGEISMRFKPLEGRIDQGAGILFNLKPNGDYLTVRANALENNLVLWQVVHGKRSSVKWIRNTPTATRQWHSLKLVLRGKTVECSLDGKPTLTHEMAAPVSGKVGVWSKADSFVYFDEYAVNPSA